MKSDIKVATVISAAAHLVLISLIAWFSSPPSERPYGEREYIVSVDLLNDSTIGSNINKFVPSPFSPPTFNPPPPFDSAQGRREGRKKGGGDYRLGNFETGNLGMGGGQHEMTGDYGTNKILAKIKARIESRKRYPRLARKMKIEGRPVVLFEINPDGSLKYVKISNSSGEGMLDEAALETVSSAAPLPYFEKPIILAIKYELE